MELEKLLLHAARRAREEPSFLGSVLARYQERSRLTDAMLAQELGVDELVLARLALCGLPRPNAFVEDVRAIAERTGVSPVLLARILREDRLGSGLRRDDRFNLKAARWREEDEEP